MNYQKRIKGIQNGSANDLVISNKPASVYFQYEDIEFRTDKGRIINLCEVISDSVEVEYYAEHREKQYIKLSLKDFENRNDNFRNQIITTTNCHGFSLTDSKYWIDNDEATLIFEDEFVECAEEECDIVAFYNGNIAEHSGKYSKAIKRIDHKEGVRPYLRSQSIEQIKSIPAYSKLTEKFLKRRILSPNNLSIRRPEIPG